MQLKQKLFLFSTSLLVNVLLQAQSPENNFKKLYSLAGTWKMETSKGVLYESWQKINDSTLKSRSYKVNGSDSVWLEAVELVRRGEKIQYIPTVQGQNDNKPVAFTLSKLENDIYIFENKTHDFPQRIVYVIPQNNALRAWIEGEVNGKLKKIEYNYAKSVVK